MGFWSYLFEEKSYDTVLVEFNGQTQNTGSLWEKALGGIHLSEFEGWKAKDMLPLIENAIKWIGKSPEDFEHLQAKNGWGTIESSLGYLNELKTACKEFPEGFYHWSG